MSAPARTIVGTGPRGSAAPARSPAPTRTRTAPKTAARTRARRKPTPAFWIVTSFVVTAMVVGVVSLSVLVVQSSFRADDLRAQIGELADRQQVLTEQVASLSSPARIAAWARRDGMVIAEKVVVLRVGDRRAGDGA